MVIDKMRGLRRRGKARIILGLMSSQALYDGVLKKASYQEQIKSELKRFRSRRADSADSTWYRAFPGGAVARGAVPLRYLHSACNIAAIPAYPSRAAWIRTACCWDADK